VEVASTRPGVKVQLRKRFVARDETDAAAEATESSLLFGARVSDLPVEIKLGEGKHGGWFLASRREIDYEVRIPIASLELEEKDGVRKADIEITFAAVDEKGDVSKPVVVKAPLRIPDARWEEARKAVWPCDGKLRSRPGRQRYVVTVRDVRSNRLGAAEVTARFD